MAQDPFFDVDLSKNEQTKQKKDPFFDVGLPTIAPAEPQQEEEGFFGMLGELITGSGRETEETRDLPEFAEVPLGGPALRNAKIMAGLLTTFDPKAQMDIIKSSIPEATFETDEKDNIIVSIPQDDGSIQRTVLNKPGASTRDIEQGIGQVLAFFPAAKLASLGKALLQRIFIAGGASGATDVAIQETSQALGSEQDFDVEQTAIATALGPIAELLGGGFQAFRNIRAAKKFGAEAEEFTDILPFVEESQEAVEGLASLSKTGEKVGLIQPQQTLVPSQLAQARAVAEIPAGARVAKAALEKQNIQVSNALDDVLETISDPLAVERAAGNFSAAAKKSIDNAKAIRTRATEPLYDAAINQFDEAGKKVPLQGVRGAIIGVLKGAPEGSSLKTSMDKVFTLLKPVNRQSPSMRKLHNAKLELDGMIEGVGNRPVSNSVQRELLDIKAALIKSLDDANPAYKAASERFAELSVPIDDLLGSTIGKVARKEDLKRLSSMIFDVEEINPQVMKQTKKVIQSIDPEAWDDLLRLHIEKGLGKIKSDKIGPIPNRPKEILDGVFGRNDRQANLILEAASPEQRKNLVWLRKVLKRAQNARPGGSDTAAKLQAKEARSVNRILGIFSPAKAASELGRTEAQQIADRKLARILFDTKFIKQMGDLRKLSIDSPAAVRALTQLFDDIGKDE